MRAIDQVGGFADFALAFFIASCLVLAGIFYGVAVFFLHDARKWVADRERTRHWKDEPLRLRPRRPANGPPPCRKARTARNSKTW